LPYIRAFVALRLTAYFGGTMASSLPKDAASQLLVRCHCGSRGLIVSEYAQAVCEKVDPNVALDAE